MREQHDQEMPTNEVPKLTKIPNSYPLLTTQIRLIYPFAQLCPVSNEPQPGSSITISYKAGKSLLETKSLRQYLLSFGGENTHSVRDLEEAAQVIAQQCADLLGTIVHVVAKYKLQIGEMEVEVAACPDISPIRKGHLDCGEAG